jgi:hypothetical protein
VSVAGVDPHPSFSPIFSSLALDSLYSGSPFEAPALDCVPDADVVDCLPPFLWQKQAQQHLQSRVDAGGADPHNQAAAKFACQ